MSEVLDRVAETQDGAHQACLHAYQLSKNLIQQGKKVHVVAQEAEDDRSIQQNRFYWGPMLGDIEEQARVNGQRYSKDAWHELGKRMFLGYEITKVAVAGRKKKTVIRRLRSTTKLSVRKMSDYLDKFQAFAATELGVRFTVPKWQEYDWGRR